MVRKAALMLALVPLAGCDRPIQIETKTATAEKPTPSPGRYQIVFSPSMRADTFLLDTQTGRVWRQSDLTWLKGDPTAWVEDDVIDAKAEVGRPTTFKDMEDTYGQKAKQ